MTFSATRLIARQAQKNAHIRAFVNSISRVRARIRQGGLTFIKDEDVLQAVLKAMQKVQTNTHQYYINELLSDENMERQYEAMRIKYNAKKYKNWEHRVKASPGNVSIYYALVRELKPNRIVETGTATGSMTSYLLAALNKNKCGQLTSLDLAPISGKLTMDLSLPQNEVGYWIPEVYKDRWTYIPGDSKVTLPRVMVDEKVDFFIHDSLHTRSHMLFEYAVARSLMREGAIIASDDVLWNNSFDDFLMLNRLTSWSPNGNPNIAVAINQFDKFETDIGTGISEQV